MFFSVLAAALLMSALPAFSGGTGPFGSFGPDTFSTDKGIESHQTAFSGGTGPYGSYGSYGMEKGVDSHQFANKDECLLVAMNCPPDSGSIQDRIDRLNTEIAKGTDVYTPSELRVLNDKLNAAYRDLNRSNSGY
jgi:hypothetical protein